MGIVSGRGRCSHGVKVYGRRTLDRLRASAHARVIAVEKISRRFGTHDAVRDLSFEVPPEGACGFLGPNGAGKTTTLRIIVGALQPDSGSVRICGVDVMRDPLDARRRIGYLPERCPLPAEMTVAEWLRHRCAVWGMGRRESRASVAEAIDQCALAEMSRRLCAGLSRGMAQRVGLAAALVVRPEVLVLDEPGAGMDPAQAHAFRALVRTLAQGRTVLFSSHNLAEVDAVCDRVIMIARGRLVAAGSMQDLRRRGVGTERWRIEADRAELAQLAAVPGVLSVRGDGIGSGWVSLEVDLAHEASESARASIARTVAAAGGTVRMMARVDEPLESVFRRLASEVAA